MYRGLITIRPVTIAAMLILVGCSRGNDVTPTAVGPLAHFDTQALHAVDTQVPPGDVSESAARCTYSWPDEDDEGFSVSVEATHVGTVLTGMSIATVRSDCALDAAVESPARYYEIGGVPDTQGILRLSFVCPRGQGSASLTFSLIHGFEMGGSTAHCIQQDERR